MGLLSVVFFCFVVQNYLLALFSVIFGLIKTLVWPSSSEIAVIFVGYVFKNSALYET